MWVEDGTRCPLYTCSDANIQPFDSQATQDVCNECAHICVRCPKSLLSDIQIENQMLLYLRQVEPTCQNCELEDMLAVVQFEVKGGVEKLPPFTRYHKTLMQRLQKTQLNPPDPLVSEALAPNDDDQLQEQPALAKEANSHESKQTVEPAEETEKECPQETAIPGPSTESHEEVLPPPKCAGEPAKRALSSDSEVVDSPPANNQRRAKLLIHRSGSPLRSAKSTKSSKPSEVAQETETVPAVSEVSPRRSARNRKPVTRSEPPQTTDATFTISRYPLRNKEVTTLVTQDADQATSAPVAVPPFEPATIAQGRIKFHPSFNVINLHSLN